MRKRGLYSRVLSEKTQLGPYPVEKLKKVDRPTTLITDKIQRFSETEHGFSRAARGDFGPSIQREFARFVTKYPLSAAQINIIKHLAVAREIQASSTRAPIPEEPDILSKHIKCVAYFLGADVVGICELPEYAIYTHHTKIKDGHSEVVPVELGHRFAIVIAVDQGYKTLEGSTGHDWISNALSFRAYSLSAFISRMLADYIKRLGYNARPHHFFDYQVIITPLLLLAGMGEVCRVGIVLNPFLGTRFKAAAVTTDMPLMPDKPVDFGLQDFCKKCKKCADYCPPGAITHGEKTIYNGYETWKPDTDLCTKFRVANPGGSGCSTCIKVCPWNKPSGWTHDTVRWLIYHAPFLNDFIIKMDDLLGYGKQIQDNKWWFDMESVEGTIQTPKTGQLS